MTSNTKAPSAADFALGRGTRTTIKNPYKVSRGEDAGHVFASQRQHTARRPSPRPLYKPVLAQPPAVATSSRALHAPDLIRLYVADDWQRELTGARNEFERFGKITPALALPLQTDPVAYRWPVSGRHVAIYGALARMTLRRLLAALLRDGAVVAGGLDGHGELHTAVAETATEAV